MQMISVAKIQRFLSLMDPDIRTNSTLHALILKTNYSEFNHQILQKIYSQKTVLWQGTIVQADFC